MQTNLWFSAQWQVFSAGIALILLSIFLFSVNGILGLFKIKAKIPSLIPWSVFVLGICIMLYSFNFWKGIYHMLLTYSIYNNLVEVAVGILFMLFALYLPNSSIINKKTRTLLFGIGIIFILDGTRVFPVISDIRSLFDALAYYIGSYAIHKPLYIAVIVAGIVVLSVVIGIVVMKVLSKFGISNRRVSKHE